MKIGAVTTCVGYGDFLAWALMANKHLFDSWIVITSTKDQQTQRLCAHHHVRCIATDAFFADERAFNKGAGINVGLVNLPPSDWIVHIDADIILPPRAREMWMRADLDPNCLYGIDRLMCRSFDDFAKYVIAPELMHEQEIFVRANAFPLGVRVAKTDQDGYIPIGFFQMWGTNSPGGKVLYPDHKGSAARGDMIFAQRWPRRCRVLLPEIVGIHLESEPSSLGANWRGRQTKPFGTYTDPGI